MSVELQDNDSNSEASEAAGVVRRYLDRRSFNGVRITVRQDLVHQRNYWWYVPIQPSVPITRVSPYYEYLAEVEQEIDEETGLNILLVPMLADE